MTNTFRRAWSGVIPGEAVTRRGIEYRVRGSRCGGPRGLCASGPAAAPWSASGLDLPPRADFHEPAPAAAGQVSGLLAEPWADYEVVLHWTPPVGCAGCLVTAQRGRQSRRRRADAIDGIHRPLSGPRGDNALRGRGAGCAGQAWPGGRGRDADRGAGAAAEGRGIDGRARTEQRPPDVAAGRPKASRLSSLSPRGGRRGPAGRGGAVAGGIAVGRGARFGRRLRLSSVRRGPRRTKGRTLRAGDGPAFGPRFDPQARAGVPRRV